MTVKTFELKTLKREEWLAMDKLIIADEIQHNRRLVKHFAALS